MKNSRMFLLLLLGGLAGCAPAKEQHLTKLEESSIETKVIYGQDNRLEHYQASSALKELADSTVALIKSADLRSSGSGFSLAPSNYGSSMQLCASEPYREQSSGAFCSGSLIGEDLVLTAGHCLQSISDCSSVRFVFDYAIKSQGVENKSFTQDQVYSCKEILHSEQISTGADFAIVRLNRKVVGRKVLQLEKQKALAVGDSLVVIGHPAGIPQKIAGGAQVRRVAAEHVVTNLDTYGGNSGSAVFSLGSGKVVGVLVRGENDFVTQGGCRVSNRCTDSTCRGEDVTRLEKVISKLPDSGGVGEPTDPEPPREEVFASNPEINIPDNSALGVESEIRNVSSVSGRKVLVKLDLSHSWKGDLLVELVSPEGAKVVLHNRSGGSADHIQGTYGLDLTPAASLAALSSAGKGDWKLKVSDRASRDTGVLKSWSLILK